MANIPVKFKNASANTLNIPAEQKLEFAVSVGVRRKRRWVEELNTVWKSTFVGNFIIFVYCVIA